MRATEIETKGTSCPQYLTYCCIFSLYRDIFLTLNIVHTYLLCSILKNKDQCIVSCYATKPNTRDFEIMLKIVPIDGIGLSCVALEMSRTFLMLWLA
jgi:hypothetical protein